MNCSSVRNKPMPSAPDSTSCGRSTIRPAFICSLIACHPWSKLDAAQRLELFLPASPKLYLLLVGSLQVGHGPQMHLGIVAIDDDRVAVFRQRHGACRLADDRNALARATITTWLVTAPSSRTSPRCSRADSRAARQHPWRGRRRSHPAGSHSPKLGTIAGQLPEQPVGEIVEVMHPLAQIGVRQPDHPRLGFALHPLDRRFRRQAVADRLFEVPDPARSCANFGASSTARLAFHRDVAARQHVFDRDAQ